MALTEMNVEQRGGPVHHVMTSTRSGLSWILAHAVLARSRFCILDPLPSGRRLSPSEREPDELTRRLNQVATTFRSRVIRDLFASRVPWLSHVIAMTQISRE